MSNEHWKEDDILHAVIAGKTWNQSRHGNDCIACSEEERWLSDALGQFRGAVHNYAASTAARGKSVRAAAHRVLPWGYITALAMLILVLLIAVPSYRSRIAHERQVRDQQDAQLLESIDEQVSSTVPAALKPLAQNDSDTQTTLLQ